MEINKTPKLFVFCPILEKGRRVRNTGLSGRERGRTAAGSIRKGYD